METNIIPSMQETLFTPISGNMGSALIEIAEQGLDSLLQDGVLKDFPVLGTIAALCKTGVNLRERNLIRQTAVFITSFNNGTISDEDKSKYKEALNKDPKRKEKELGRVILLLDRLLEEQQAKVLGKFYCSYVKGAISWDKFVELSEVNARMFSDDYKDLAAINKEPVKTEERVSDQRAYKIQRLISLGLVSENHFGLNSSITLSFMPADNRFIVTPLGSTFASLMK